MNKYVRHGAVGILTIAAFFALAHLLDIESIERCTAGFTVGLLGHGAFDLVGIPLAFVFGAKWGGHKHHRRG